MNKSLINKTLILVLVSLYLFSCSKESDVSTTPQVSYTDPSNFVVKMMPASQTFKIDASKTVKITTNSGSNFYFKAGTFNSSSGPINSGTIEIKILEVNKKSEMMASGAGTEAENGILTSAGMFKIEAFQKDSALSLDPKKPIKVEIPADSVAPVEDFKIFKGTENPSSGKVIWKETKNDTVSGKDSLRIQNNGQKNIYCFNLNFLSWCNLDRYYNAPGGASIKAAVTGSYSSSNCRVFLSINLNASGGPKGLIELNSDKIKEQWTTLDNYNLPFNQKYMLIVTAVNSATKELEFGFMEFTHQAGKVYTFDKLTPISEADLKAKIEALK